MDSKYWNLVFFIILCVVGTTNIQMGTKGYSAVDRDWETS